MHKLMVIVMGVAALAALGCSKKRDANESARVEYNVTPGSATVGESTTATGTIDPAEAQPVSGVGPVSDPARAPAASDSQLAGTDRGIETSGTTGMTEDETGVPGTIGTAPAPGAPRVIDPADTPPTRTGDTAEDLDLTGRIEAAYSNSTFIDDARAVTVITNAGVVTLRGSVKSEAAKRELMEIAAAVPGVRMVSNQIQVME